jgi:putative aldouronate transport system permease protein
MRPGGLATKYSLLLAVIPLMLLVFTFSYLPLYGWIYAFFNYKPGIPLSRSTFVGLKNFAALLRFDSYMVNVLRNTLVLSFLGILAMPIPFLFAVLLSQLNNAPFKRIVQTASTLPFYISWITVYSLAFALFSNEGLVYQLLTALGVRNARVNVLGNARWAWFVQIAFSVWKNAGYQAIIYFAAIAAIDPEQYDAAKVDGANRLQLIRYITAPGVSMTFLVLFLLTTASLLSNGFDQYFVFYNPLVAERLEVLDYYVYVVGLGRGNDIPYATAVGMMKTIISITLLFSANFVSRKVRGESLF